MFTDNGDQTVEHNDFNEDTGNTDSAFVDIRDEHNNDDSEHSNNANVKSEKEDEEFDGLAITICNVCHPVPLHVLMPNEKDADYKGEFYKSPYEFKPIEPKIRVSASEKLVADTLFAMMYKPRSYKKLRCAKLEVVKLDFKKRNDHADCEIIVMTAMDCYTGKVKKLKDMILEGIPYTQLLNLRQMIATKIMLSKINIRNINKSSAEYIEDNSNNEDNEDSNSAEEEQNNEDSDSLKTPPVKKRGRPKKFVKDNENKTSSVKRRGRPRKNNDESKKQTIGSKRKGREYKVEDGGDNDGTKRMKKKMDHREAKKCLYEMGFGSLIGMVIYELPGMLGFYVIENLDTETNVLSLTDNSILVNSQSVHDILGIPMGGCSLESLESRSADDPFIKGWFSQIGDKNEV
nr:hypothetical protein [Tanacetum cinerariifolium]GEZ10588.1 hypothetical protein [Tanacetum cinerariifolium]